MDWSSLRSKVTGGGNARRLQPALTGGRDRLEVDQEPRRYVFGFVRHFRLPRHADVMIAPFRRLVQHLGRAIRICPSG